MTSMAAPVTTTTTATTAPTTASIKLSPSPENTYLKVDINRCMQLAFVKSEMLLGFNRACIRTLQKIAGSTYNIKFCTDHMI